MPRRDKRTVGRLADVLGAIRAHPRITNDGLMRRLTLSYRQVQRATQALRRAGRISAHITEHLGFVQWRIKR
jgi:predicted DNA-binding transcriptional regulator YafY